MQQIAMKSNVSASKAVDVFVKEEKTANKQAISLKGSIDIVTEFFDYSLNSILYQRGLYPSECFKMEQKYGLSIMMTHDKDLKLYIRTILSQVQEWLQHNAVQKIILAITSTETGEVVERWQFDVQLEFADNKENIKTSPALQRPSPGKSLKAIHGEIAAIIRQITASVSFLPILEGTHKIDMLVYTDRHKDIDVPESWGDSDPKFIPGGGEQVRLRSFSTTFHKVDSLVAYKMNDGF